MVKNQDEILDNVEGFLEALELGSEQEIAKAKEIIKQADTFLAVLSDEVNIFVPSSFLAYQEMTIENYQNKVNTEKESNPLITQILGSTPKIDKTMDELFLDFCDEIEINRNDVGLSREYWILKNI